MYKLRFEIVEKIKALIYVTQKIQNLRIIIQLKRVNKLVILKQLSVKISIQNLH